MIPRTKVRAAGSQLWLRQAQFHPVTQREFCRAQVKCLFARHGPLWLIQRSFSPQPNLAFNRDADAYHRFGKAKRAPVNLALGFSQKIIEACMKRRALFKSPLFAAFLMWLMSATAGAATNSLDDLEKLDRYQRAIDASNKLEAMVDENARKRTLACMKAFGHAPMCQCLSDNLPYAFTLTDYIAITTQTKEQNGYAKLDKDMKAAYDRVASVRDKCVRETIK
jgi:hypothetical protein